MTILLLVSLLDGSTLNLQIPASTVFDFRTRYGVLKIPAQQVSECQLGVHVDEPPLFEQSIKDLGSDLFLTRTKATRFLKENHRGAYPYLLALNDSKDPESKRRAELLLKDYDEKPDIQDLLIDRQGDRLTGMILQRELEGQVASIGPVKLKLSAIRGLQVSGLKSSIKLEIGDGWRKVRQYTSGKLSIMAFGEVDLWVQQPGQYVVRACGHSSSFEGQPAGALIGRVGSKVFLVGESFRGSPPASGTLELKINGSPWGTFGGMAGGFDVTVE